jgi:hypothetical protein
VLFLTSCGSNIKHDKSEVLYKKLHCSSNNGNTVFGLTVIKDYNSLIKNTKQLAIEDFNYLKISQIDFKKNNVAIIHLGQKNTGGFSVEIEKITKKNNILTIVHKEITPNKNDNVPMVITNPYCIIEIPKAINTVLK